jgi:hypothetical protein
MMALAPTVVLTSVSGSRLLVVQLILTQGAHMGLKGKPVQYRRGPATVNKEHPLARPLSDKPGKDSGSALRCRL